MPTEDRGTPKISEPPTTALLHRIFDIARAYRLLVDRLILKRLQVDPSSVGDVLEEDDRALLQDCYQDRPSPPLFLAHREFAWNNDLSGAFYQAFQRCGKNFRQITKFINYSGGDKTASRATDLKLQKTTKQAVAYYYGAWRSHENFKQHMKEKEEGDYKLNLRKCREMAWFHFWRFDEAALRQLECVAPREREDSPKKPAARQKAPWRFPCSDPTICSHVGAKTSFNYDNNISKEEEVNHSLLVDEDPYFSRSRPLPYGYSPSICLHDRMYESSKNEEADNEPFCFLCGDGGDLFCCDGDCRRSFHSSCVQLEQETLKSVIRNNDTLREDPRFRKMLNVRADGWLCSACATGVHECFICGTNGIAGIDVFMCQRRCGKFYHLWCVASDRRTTFLNGGNRNKRIPSNQLIDFCRVEGNKPHSISFSCPYHTCTKCGMDFDAFTPAFYYRCHACPSIYHEACLPEQVKFEAEEVITCPDTRAHSQKVFSPFHYAHERVDDAETNVFIHPLKENLLSILQQTTQKIQEWYRKYKCTENGMLLKDVFFYLVKQFHMNRERKSSQGNVQGRDWENTGKGFNAVESVSFLDALSSVRVAFSTVNAFRQSPRFAGIPLATSLTQSGFDEAALLDINQLWFPGDKQHRNVAEIPDDCRYSFTLNGKNTTKKNSSDATEKRLYDYSLLLNQEELFQALAASMFPSYRGQTVESLWIAVEGGGTKYGLDALAHYIGRYVIEKSPDEDTSWVCSDIKKNGVEQVYIRSRTSLQQKSDSSVEKAYKFYDLKVEENCLKELMKLEGALGEKIRNCVQHAGFDASAQGEQFMHYPSQFAIIAFTLMTYSDTPVAGPIKRVLLEKIAQRKRIQRPSLQDAASKYVETPDKFPKTAESTNVNYVTIPELSGATSPSCGHSEMTDVSASSKRQTRKRRLSSSSPLSSSHSPRQGTNSIDRTTAGAVQKLSHEELQSFKLEQRELLRRHWQVAESLSLPKPKKEAVRSYTSVRREQKRAKFVVRLYNRLYKQDDYLGSYLLGENGARLFDLHALRIRGLDTHVNFPQERQLRLLELAAGCFVPSNMKRNPEGYPDDPIPTPATAHCQPDLPLVGVDVPLGEYPLPWKVILDDQASKYKEELEEWWDNNLADSHACPFNPLRKPLHETVGGLGLVTQGTTELCVRMSASLFHKYVSTAKCSDHLKSSVTTSFGGKSPKTIK